MYYYDIKLTIEMKAKYDIYGNIDKKETKIDIL